MPELEKPDREQNVDPSNVKTHRRAIHSIDQGRRLIPDNQFQYENNQQQLPLSSSSLRHRRLPSEQPFSTIPRHMRTISFQDNLGHHRDVSNSSGIYMVNSPYVATPDLEVFPTFGSHEHGQPNIPFQTPQPLQGGFAVPAQPLPPQEQRVLSHNGTPLVIDQAAFGQFQGFLGGSPGPMVTMYSPNPKGINAKFTGLTPLLNFSPYPDYVQDIQNTPKVQGESREPDMKLDKHQLSSADSSLEMESGQVYSPKKKKKMELTSSSATNEGYSEYPDERSMQVPGPDYTEQAVNHAWTDGDVAELVGLLESGERFKWRYTSDQFYAKYNKRIPGIACSKKYKELFGEPESSSILGSSLFYIAYQQGWISIKAEMTEMERDVG